MNDDRPTGADDLAARLGDWSERLEWLIPWLDTIDKLAEKLGRPDLASTEMQDDLRAMIVDARAAAARLWELREAGDALAAAARSHAGWRTSVVAALNRWEQTR